MELTVELVREWLATNKGEEKVKALLTELGKPVLTPETVRPWLATDEGQKLIEPIIDRERTRAVKTHDDKTREEREAAVKKAVEEAVAKANPKETPEQKELREFKAEYAKEKQMRERSELRLARDSLAKKKGVDTFLPGDYLPTNLEAAEAEMDRISAAVEERITKAKNELLGTGHKPGSGNNGATGGKVDLAKLPLADMVKLERSGQLNTQLAR